MTIPSNLPHRRKVAELAGLKTGSPGVWPGLLLGLSQVHHTVMVVASLGVPFSPVVAFTLTSFTPTRVPMAGSPKRAS